MLILTMLLAAAEPPVPTADELLASYRRATTVAVRCPTEAVPGEVVVCGRRRSDRYRLPLTGGTGSSGADLTPAERTALLVPPNNCEQNSPFLVGCGHAGVGVGVGSDGKTRFLKPRALSP